MFTRRSENAEELDLSYQKLGRTGRLESIIFRKSFQSTMGMQSCSMIVTMVNSRSCKVILAGVALAGDMPSCSGI